MDALKAALDRNASAEELENGDQQADGRRGSRSARRCTSRPVRSPGRRAARADGGPADGQGEPGGEDVVDGEYRTM